jgi:hypothetical protein
MSIETFLTAGLFRRDQAGRTIVFLSATATRRQTLAPPYPPVLESRRWFIVKANSAKL